RSIRTGSCGQAGNTENGDIARLVFNFDAVTTEVLSKNVGAAILDAFASWIPAFGAVDGETEINFGKAECGRGQDISNSRSFNSPRLLELAPSRKASEKIGDLDGGTVLPSRGLRFLRLAVAASYNERAIH